MDTKNLYIFGGDYDYSSFKFKKNSKVIFFDSHQNIFENQYSVLSTFKENQDLLRDKWILFQDKVFQKIKPMMNNDQDYRYLLSNIFFEASPNKTKSIYQFFKILIIKEFIKNPELCIEYGKKVRKIAERQLNIQTCAKLNLEAYKSI